jgi:hypothetical protein
MQIRGLALAVSLGVSAVLSGGAQAAEAKQDFILDNETGYEIKAVYVSPNKSDNWEEDVLGKDTLGDGQKFRIKFNRATKTCLWDLKVVYAIDNSKATWGKIDLCTVRKITIMYNKKNDTTSAKFD